MRGNGKVFQKAAAGRCFAHVLGIPVGVNGLDDELRAMQDIAVALHRLDQPTRGRVLRWIVERFQSDLPAATVALPAAPTRVLSSTASHDVDETLSVESLNDLFPPRTLATVNPAAPLLLIAAELQDLEPTGGAQDLESPSLRIFLAAGMDKMAHSVEPPSAGVRDLDRF
jgi:hypothetical protein